MTDGKRGDNARVLIYARVSTDEQYRSGYSVPGQLSELEKYCEAHGHEIVDRAIDDGHSGTHPHRPGIDLMLQLAIDGAIDLVLATRRDRLFRSSFWRQKIERDLKPYGVELRALNDMGHKLGDRLQDDFAEYEIDTLVDRSRSGRHQKLRQGLIVANNSVNYGFRYNHARDGYEIDPQTMPTVHRIFEMLADGNSLYAVVKSLQDDPNAPPPSKSWNRAFVRKNLILDDAYKPHGKADLQALVDAGNLCADVLDKLDDGPHGIYWANWRNVETDWILDEGQARYKKTTRTTTRDRSEWIAVPVPHAGIPSETVERARAAIDGNRKASSAGRRDFWELSSGIARCGLCTRALTPFTVDKPERGQLYHYYACRSRYRESAPDCPNTKSVRAQKLEAQVSAFVSRLLRDAGKLTDHIDVLIQQERGAMHDPGPEHRRLQAELNAIAKERDGYFRLAATRDDVTNAELDQWLAELEQRKAGIEHELAGAADRLARIQQLECDKQTVREAAKTTGLAGFTPKQRHGLYRRMRLVVHTSPLGGFAVDAAGGNFPDNRIVVELEDDGRSYFGGLEQAETLTGYDAHLAEQAEREAGLSIEGVLYSDNPTCGGLWVGSGSAAA